MAFWASPRSVANGLIAHTKMHLRLWFICVAGTYGLMSKVPLLQSNTHTLILAVSWSSCKDGNSVTGWLGFKPSRRKSRVFKYLFSAAACQASHTKVNPRAGLPGVSILWLVMPRCVRYSMLKSHHRKERHGSALSQADSLLTLTCTCGCDFTCYNILLSSYSWCIWV